MQFPWTVIYETPKGRVEARNILGPSNPEDTLLQVANDLHPLRVVAVLKGSQAGTVYGAHLLRGLPVKEQIPLPFPTAGCVG